MPEPDEMERSRAARMVFDSKAPPVGKDAVQRRAQAEMEAFMAIFHPGREVPRIEPK